jgi:hypothetical protein
VTQTQTKDQDAMTKDETMPRTRDQLEEAAAAAEQWLDDLDLDETPLTDSSDLRRITEALRGQVLAEAELRSAVAYARANGRTWAQIGVVLGVTRQTAQGRFGHLQTRSDSRP